MEVKERWSDKNANNAILRPSELENICLDEMQMRFDRIDMKVKIRKKRDKEMETKGIITYRICEQMKDGTLLLFHEEHPGYSKVCLKK